MNTTPAKGTPTNGTITSDDYAVKIPMGIKHWPFKTDSPALDAATALARQPGGTHYKEMKWQPVEFIHANNIPFIEGNIIKYACRWRAKGGIKDLEKIVHYAQLLIEMEQNE